MKLEVRVSKRFFKFAKPGFGVILTSETLVDPEGKNIPQRSFHRPFK